MLKTIFVVDDTDSNLAKAEEALEGHYQVITLPSAAKMFTFLEKVIPDLILLDIKMPEMDGFEALQLLKSNDSFGSIPVIFLTASSDEATEVRGFEMGVIDFIAKPFSGPVLLKRLETHLNIDDLIRERTRELEQRTLELEQRTKELERMKNGLVYAFADAVETRDKGTGGHIRRTSAYMEVLIKEMIASGLYAQELDGLNLESLISSARLHDVGKIAIPDAILNKDGSLTFEEFEQMKTHTTEGENFINKITNRTGSEVSFLNNAKLFAGYHHERWDGSGYPNGLKGNDIPLLGRIMAVVDVYDALTSKRPYKRPFTEEETVNLILENSSKLFDPSIVEIFLSVRDKFNEIKLDTFEDDL